MGGGENGLGPFSLSMCWPIYTSAAIVDRRQLKSEKGKDTERQIDKQGVLTAQTDRQTYDEKKR